jgi:hypothetical protein
MHPSFDTASLAGGSDQNEVALAEQKKHQSSFTALAKARGNLKRPAFQTASSG